MWWKRKEKKEVRPASLTDDPNDPRIKRGGGDASPGPQNDVYLVLPEKERAKGFVRPLRRSYEHVGPPGPKYPLRGLTEEEEENHRGRYAVYEEYPEEEAAVGRFWTQKHLDEVAKCGCGAVTKMGLALCETYARDPHFYGATYCVGCRMHKPVDEFIWEEDGVRLGS